MKEKKPTKCPYHPIQEPKPYRIGHTLLELTEEAIEESKLKKVERVHKLNYKTKDWFVRPNLKGYYKAEELLPMDFDLVQLKTASGYYPGWWTGTGWWCRQKLKDDEVIAWRKHDLPEGFVLTDDED